MKSYEQINAPFTGAFFLPCSYPTPVPVFFVKLYLIEI